MIRERIASIFRKVRQSGANAPLAISVLAATTLLIVGARIPIPGIDPQVLAEYLRTNGGNAMLKLFDWLVGGALSRGAVLALGIMPYISARIYLRLARWAVPTLARTARRPGGVERIARWAPRLTLVLAVAESYGFARFVQNIPGAVANPGPLFIAQTVAVLTASALTVTWLAERARKSGAGLKYEGVEPDEVQQFTIEPAAVVDAQITPPRETLLLSPAGFLEAPPLSREPEKISVNRGAS